MIFLSPVQGAMFSIHHRPYELEDEWMGNRAILIMIRDALNSFYATIETSGGTIALLHGSNETRVCSLASHENIFHIYTPLKEVKKSDFT